MTWLLVALLHGAWQVVDTGERGGPFMIGEACVLHLLQRPRSEEARCVDVRSGQVMLQPR